MMFSFNLRSTLGSQTFDVAENQLAVMSDCAYLWIQLGLLPLLPLILFIFGHLILDQKCEPNPEISTRKLVNLLQLRHVSHSMLSINRSLYSIYQQLNLCLPCQTILATVNSIIGNYSRHHKSLPL